MNIGIRQLIESDVFDYAQLIDVLSSDNLLRAMSLITLN